MYELQKHFDLFKRIVITHRKDLCQGDYLIDDRGKNGTSDFAGEWIEFGSEKFPDWKSMLVYLGIVSQEHLDFIKSFDYWADRYVENILNSMDQ